jgi:hypothetical protein
MPFFFFLSLELVPAAELEEAVDADDFPFAFDRCGINVRQ